MSNLHHIAVTPRDLHPSTTNVPPPISQEEYSFYKLTFGNDVSAVRFQKLHCTACDAHIGSAPAEAHNMFEHPVLRTLLCAKCRDFYGDGTFEQGDDATDMFCRWCANGGNLYCCSFCSNTFCYKCIKRNFDPCLRKKIEADEKWKCFVCDPRDLYTARATCWALLQYVHTMNRSLQNNCKLSQEEIDQKSHLDETKCCPRKRKRKRRRTASNSEEDDKTYIPNQEELNMISKRKKKGRSKTKLSNGSNMSIFSRSHSEVSEENSVTHNEILPSLFSCEQMMLECENATVNTDGTVQINSSQKANSNVVQQPMMYNTAIMNVVTTPNLLQPTSSIVPFRHVPGSVTPINQMNQMNLYQAMPYASAPMVTIPNQNVNILNQSPFSVTESQTTIRASPNVIEIESDSEDVAVVGPSQISRSFKNHVDSNKAVPVALVSSKNNYKNARRQEMLGKCNVKTLNQRLLPHSQEIDNILTNLKTKLHSLFDVSKREVLKKYELNDARVIIKQFHREIRDTVTQLAYINDRIVHEYNRWKRCHLKTGVAQSSDSNNAHSKNKHEEILLDMTCTNESDSDSENSAEIEYSIMNPSEFVGNTNAVEGIKFFKKKNTVDRAVGDDSVSSVDKSIQIYDAELQDYDMCIRHSALKKGDKQSEKRNSTSTPYIKEVEKEFSNYEEHFIEFLKKRSMETPCTEADRKNLPDPNETPLKDLIEANSPFISEMLETMDKSIFQSTNNLNVSIKKESNTESEIQPTNSVTCKAVDDLVRMVSNINDNVDDKKTATNASICIKDSEEESEIQLRDSSTSDGVCTIDVLKNNEQSLSRTNCNVVDSESSNEDDCTIIDD